MSDDQSFEDALAQFESKSDPSGLIELFSIPLHISVRGFLDPETKSVDVHLVQTDEVGSREDMEDSVLSMSGRLWLT